MHDHDGDDGLHPVSRAHPHPHQRTEGSTRLLAEKSSFSVHLQLHTMILVFFVRGKGPLKNTSDVISAAKKIAEAGSRMDKLGRTIADHVSDSLASWLPKFILELREPN